MICYCFCRVVPFVKVLSMGNLNVKVHDFTIHDIHIFCGFLHGFPQFVSMSSHRIWRDFEQHGHCFGMFWHDLARVVRALMIRSRHATDKFGFGKRVNFPCLRIGLILRSESGFVFACAFVPLIFEGIQSLMKVIRTKFSEFFEVWQSRYSIYL